MEKPIMKMERAWAFFSLGALIATTLGGAYLASLPNHNFFAYLGITYTDSPPRFLVFGRAISIALLLQYILLVMQLYVTVTFSAKQTDYHYRRGGIGKEGLFVEHIFEVNRLEETLDVTLCLLSGIAFICAVIARGSWFVAIGAYSLIVAARCGATLLRPLFANSVSPPITSAVRDVYADAHRVSYNGHWVPAVLRGWLAVHGTVGLFAFLFGVWSLASVPALPILTGTLVYIAATLALWVGLLHTHRLSYRVGVVLSRRELAAST